LKAFIALQVERVARDAPLDCYQKQLFPPRIPIVARMCCSMSLAELGDLHEPNSSRAFRQRPREGTRDNGHIATPAQL
jgi:hypothetical protein